MESNHVTRAIIDVRCPTDRDHMHFQAVGQVDDEQQNKNGEAKHENDEERRKHASDVTWLRQWIRTDHPTTCLVCNTDIDVEIAWPSFHSATVPVTPAE